VVRWEQAIVPRVRSIERQPGLQDAGAGHEDVVEAPRRRRIEGVDRRRPGLLRLTAVRRLMSGTESSLHEGRRRLLRVGVEIADDETFCYECSTAPIDEIVKAILADDDEDDEEDRDKC